MTTTAHPATVLDYVALNRRLRDLYQLQEQRELLPEEIREGIEICAQLRKTNTGPARPKSAKKAPVDLQKLQEDLLS